MKKRIYKILAVVLLTGFLLYTGNNNNQVKASVNPGTYMHQGWCPSGWFDYGTYCNETYSTTKCSNPTC